MSLLAIFAVSLILVIGTLVWHSYWTAIEEAEQETETLARVADRGDLHRRERSRLFQCSP